MERDVARVHSRVRTYCATIGLAAVMLVWFAVFHILLVRLSGTADVAIVSSTLGVHPNAPFAPRTYVTALFSHVTVYHVLVNVAGIGVGGLVIEREFGSRSVLVVFLAAGLLSIGGYVVSCSLITACGYGLGASGGVYGLYGATMASVVATRARDFRTILAIGCLIAVSRQLLVLLQPGTQIVASVHLTGAVVGVGFVILTQVIWSRANLDTT